MAPPRKIALFGGSFDPVHEGHLEIATKAITELALDSLVFLPCRRSPLKEEAPGADDQDRLAMLRLAIADLPRCTLDDFELRKPPPSYTWESVRHFQKRHADASLFLLIGFDQWRQLDRWRQLDFLRDAVTFIVVGRNSQPEPRSGFSAVFIEGHHPASSTQIRRDLREGTTPQWLPPTVESYIREKELYFQTS